MKIHSPTVLHRAVSDNRGKRWNDEWLHFKNFQYNVFVIQIAVNIVTRSRIYLCLSRFRSTRSQVELRAIFSPILHVVWKSLSFVTGIDDKKTSADRERRSSKFRAFYLFLECGCSIKPFVHQKKSFFGNPKKVLFSFKLINGKFLGRCTPGLSCIVVKTVITADITTDNGAPLSSIFLVWNNAFT